MDAHVANGLISNSYHCSSENAEINIDNIITAVAELNIRILRLREEIVALKNEIMVSSVLMYNLSLTPAGFNQSTKNEENRTSARYEPRRNFKRDDSPSGTDLSARLSFAKRAREVKAANEVAVFKEDYPRDDKSIEDDERPNRSRVSEPSRTYRKSILENGEKSGKETDERPENIRDTGNAKTLLIANEKLRKFNEHQNEVVSKTDCSPANVFIRSKIKRKRISRGVQCVSIESRRHASQFLFNCFKSQSRRHSLDARKAKKKKALADKFDVGLQNEVNSSPGAISESRNVIKEEIKSTCDTDTKKEEFEINEEKIEKVTYENDKELHVQMQNAHDEKSKDNDDSRYRKMKINLLKKLLRGALTRDKNDSKTQQGGYKSRNHKEEIAGLNYESKRINGKDNSQNIKIVDRQMDSSNEQWTITSASVDRRSDVNKIKGRLDSCIAELNGIIDDACTIFDKRNGRGS